MVTLPINATQAMGLGAFFTAFILASTAVTAYQGVERKVWVCIAAANALCVLEVLLGTRHALHDIADGYLRLFGLHAGRRSLQAYILLVLTVVVASTLVWIARGSLYAAIRRARARAAATATLATSTIFAVETVSLHQIDAVLYRHVGPVLVIGWLWVMTALAVSASAALAKLRASAAPSSTGKQ
jgi:nitrate/nitrite transporter NarK